MPIESELKKKERIQSRQLNRQLRANCKQKKILKMSTEIIACFPGQKICSSSENIIAGTGTYERFGYVYSSLAGTVERKKDENVSFKKTLKIKIKLFSTFRTFIFVLRHQDKP